MGRVAAELQMDDQQGDKANHSENQPWQGGSILRPAQVMQPPPL